MKWLSGLQGKRVELFFNGWKYDQVIYKEQKWSHGYFMKNILSAINNSYRRHAL